MKTIDKSRRTHFFLSISDEDTLVDYIKSVYPDCYIIDYLDNFNTSYNLLSRFSESTSRILFITRSGIFDVDFYAEVRKPSAGLVFQFDRCFEKDDVMHSGSLSSGIYDDVENWRDALEFSDFLFKSIRKLFSHKISQINPVSQDVLSRKTNPIYHVGPGIVEWMNGDDRRLLRNRSVELYYKHNS